MRRSTINASLAIAVFAGLLLTAGEALARDNIVTARPGPVGSDGRSVVDKDGRVCRVIVKVGSRLRSAKVCKTAEEWDRLAAEAKSMIEDSQRRSLTGNTIQ